MTNADSIENTEYKKTPTVSVLMTAYNDEKYIGAAIESILNQTFSDFEFIIVNDGSTDKTGSIIDELAKKDKRILHIKQKNSGTTVAANNGLKISRGKYIARLDSDDLSYPHRLEKEVGFLDSHSEVALVGGGSDLIDFNGNVVGVRNIITNHPAKTLIHRCIFQQSDVMFRKDVVLKLGGYREKFYNSQDYDLWLRISEVASIAKLPDIIGKWRLNKGGYTYSRKIEQLNEVKIIKQMANQRRNSGRDFYNEYNPPAVKKHRQEISETEYNFVIINYMILSLRTKEARTKLLEIINKEGITFRSLILCSLSLLPKLFLKIAFSIRNFIKNTF